MTHHLIMATMGQRLSAVLLGLTPVLCQGQSDPATSLGSTPGTEAVHVKELSPSQLASMLGSSSMVIYDCNEADMFAEAHVPGAVLTVYDAVTATDLPADRNAKLVFYCYSPECPAAGMAARTAATLGYMEVYCMSAGITGWQDAGLKTEP